MFYRLKTPSIAVKLLLSGTLLFAAALQVHAAQLTLIYTDTFTSQDSVYLASGSPTYFAVNTPFKVVATFDTTTPSFSLPGFNAYVPLSAILTVGGANYTMTDAELSIFDLSNIFEPGAYAVGFIQNPALDQAGFVADFSGATTDFLVGNILPTTFTGYNGTGFQPGSGIPPGCAATDTCTGNNDTPIHLIASDGTAYYLTMGARDSGPLPTATASIVTPEPSALILTFAGISTLLYRRRRSTLGSSWESR